MKTLTFALISLCLNSNIFAAEATCYPFKKIEQNGNVLLHTHPNYPELTSKVVALNEEVADKLAALEKTGTLCVKGTPTTAGYLIYDAYAL